MSSQLLLKCRLTFVIESGAPHLLLLVVLALFLHSRGLSRFVSLNRTLRENSTVDVMTGGGTEGGRRGRERRREKVREGESEGERNDRGET